MKISGRRQDNAVSEIIGTVLLISIVVLAVSIVAVAVFSQPQAQKIPVLSALISNQSQVVSIKHDGGESLANGTYKILVDGTDVTSSITTPSTWSIGETLTYTKPGTTPPSSVVIVYTGSGSPVVIADSYFGMLTASGTITVPTPTPSSTPSPTPTQTPAPTPTVSGISPTSGPATGTTGVTITGTGFTSAATVNFGATAGTSVTFVSATQITATSPAGSGTVDVTVTTVGGTSATSANDRFTYTGVTPTVSGISPPQGDKNGGNPVTITGTGFTSASTVMFGTVAATASFSETGGTQIKVNAPQYSTGGTVDVTVTTNGVTSATSTADQYLYTGVPPTVTSISPASGPAAGGTSVTIYGTGFYATSTVKFGNNAAPSVTFISNTQIIALSPAGTGTVDVTVTTTPPGGTSATSANDKYIYGPVITSSSPSSGTKNGGTTVTINGSGFTGATAVSFGGTPATSFTVNSDSKITAISPAHASGGPVDITVTTPGGTSPTSSNDYFTWQMT
jgi:hypothetical protein